MRYLLSIFILSVFVFSCSEKETKQNKQSNHKEEKGEMPEMYRSERIAYIKKDYTFIGKDLCEPKDGPPNPMDPDLFLKYGRNKPFHFKLAKEQDTIIISFEKIYDCCLEPRVSVYLDMKKTR